MLHKIFYLWIRLFFISFLFLFFSPTKLNSTQLNSTNLLVFFLCFNFLYLYIVHYTLYTVQLKSSCRIEYEFSMNFSTKTFILFPHAPPVSVSTFLSPLSLYSLLLHLQVRTLYIVHTTLQENIINLMQNYTRCYILHTLQLEKRLQYSIA